MKVKVLNIIDSSTFKGISTVYKKHSRYHKYVTTHNKYLVDSAGLKVNVGDEIEIVPCRPISRLKRWSIKNK